MYLYWAGLDGYNVLVLGKPLKKIGSRVKPIPEGRYPPAIIESLHQIFIEGGFGGMLVEIAHDQVTLMGGWD